MQPSDASAIAAQGLARLRERASRELLLDANADAPVRPEVLHTYLDACAAFADESADHASGVEARAALARACQRIGDVVGCAAEQVWLTSGGTEADALALAALAATRPTAFVISTIEHAAVARSAAAFGLPVHRVRVGRSGRLDLADVSIAITDGCAMSIVAASNETGAIQPVSSIVDIAHRRGVLVHSDAIQLPGRASCDVRALGADLVTFSSHKIGAPGGVGVVIAPRDMARPSSWQEPRANIAGATAFAHALEVLPSASDQAAIAASRDALEQAIVAAVPAAWVIAADGPRLANTCCIAFDGSEGDAIMMALDVRGIAVSTGSACSSGSIEASPILIAMGLTPREAKSTIRISLARALTASERQAVVSELAAVVARA